MRISVALCTYNGERHVREQLRSLAAQLRPPDELIVLDDASTDQTVRLVKEFAVGAPFPVRVRVNGENVGSTRNFCHAIAACTGDAIALCDQDDIWMDQKLVRVEQALGDRPDALLVCSDALLVDDGLRPLDRTLWEAVRIDAEILRQIESGQGLTTLLRRNVFTGATMVFRRSLRELVRPIPQCWVHDGWIALLAAAVGGIGMVPEPLVMYRQHGGQQIGGRVLGLREQLRIARTMDLHYFQQEHSKFEAALERLGERSGSVREKLEGKLSHQAARAAMRNGGRRLPAVVNELRKGNYARYSPGWKAVVQDLFL